MLPFKRFALPFGFLWALPLPAWAAEALAPGEAALSHVDLNVSDIKANQDFWTAIGGVPGTWRLGSETLAGVSFGDVRILLRQRGGVAPAAGSGINHFGLYVRDVQKAVAAFNAKGLKTQAGRNAQQAYVITPGDLIRIELLEMPGQAAPEVFHHVHYAVFAGAAGGIPDMQAWYARLLGAAPGKRAAFDMETLPGGELTFQNSAMPTAPTEGRAVDRVGFAVRNLEAVCRNLRDAGIRPDTPCPDRAAMPVLLTDPWGNRIELDEMGALVPLGAK